MSSQSSSSSESSTISSKAFVVHDHFLVAVKKEKLTNFIEGAKPFLQRLVPQWDNDWKSKIVEEDAYKIAVMMVKEKEKFVHCSCGELYCNIDPNYKSVKGAYCTVCGDVLKKSMRKKSNFHTESNEISVPVVAIPIDIPDMLVTINAEDVQIPSAELMEKIRQLKPSDNGEDCLNCMYGAFKFSCNDDNVEQIPLPKIEKKYRKVLKRVKSWEEAITRMLIDIVVNSITDLLEYTIGANNNTDYSLFNNDTVRVIVEAKSLKKNLVSENLGQLLIYLVREEVNIGILSNGCSYWVLTRADYEIKYRNFEILEKDGSGGWQLKEGNLQKLVSYVIGITKSTSEVE